LAKFGTVKVEQWCVLPPVLYPNRDWQGFKEWQAVNEPNEVFKLMIEKNMLKDIEKAAKLKEMSVNAFIIWCITNGTSRTLELDNITPQIFP
jgi:hypothetical protein